MLNSYHCFPKNTVPSFFRPFALLLFFGLLGASLAAQTTENCTNGIDDDGDGLIDCYDTDCTCTGQCDNFYYTTCNADCYFVPPCGQISMGIQWTSTANTETYSPMVAGDMDNDGIPDIVTYQCEQTNIYIIDGATGATKVTIVSPTILPGGTAPAIADLDKDGFGEIVIVGEDRRLRCYEHTGALKFTSSVQVGYGSRYRFSVPSIADMNHDGWAEVLIGNQVYSGQSGALLASGGNAASAGEHPQRRANNFSFNMPVAIDALPDNFCPDCDGLEIVAGNQVMSVNLATGAVTVVVSAPPGYSDGFTSVVDFDGDGDLDAIVQGQRNNTNYVYCWDIQTPTVLRGFQLLNNWQEGASRVNVADLNGDGKLEISFVGYPWLYALDNDFNVLWQNATNDVSSVTCSSVFDFCGDGSADIVYRGQSKLQIIEGATGQVKWEDNCVSATHIENPLILDVDADGQTEVVIQCGGFFNGVGNVICYEAVGTPGIASRQVWNQHAYFNTNINDDLSVPQYQQNPHIIGDSLRLNTFLNQFFNPTFPSPDGVLSFESVECQMDSMAITLRVCNTGDNVIPAVMPLSVYKGNPFTTNALWAGSAPVGATVDLGDCITFTVKVQRDAVINDSVYVVLNDNHSVPTPYNLSQFPLTNIGECGFTNNAAAFFFAYQPDAIALGNDTLICANGVIPVSAAGNDLITWLWQDGSTQAQYTITAPGEYHVQTTDICSVVQTDTIRITLDSSTIVQLGPDLNICQGETVTVGTSGFDYYDWKPGPSYNCTDCPSVTAYRSVSGPIILEAGFMNGCKSTDTLFLTVNDTFFIQIDTFICKGDAVFMNGETILPGASRFFNLSTFAGCDSTILLNVFPKDTFATFENAVICPGGAYNVFGQMQTQSGIYQKLFTAVNGCDSTHTIELLVQPLLQLALSSEPSCNNEPSGALNAMVNGGAAPYQFQWSQPGLAPEPQLAGLPPGQYRLTITDANNCTETAATNIGVYPPIVYEVAIDSVRCFGEGNGAISITATDTTLLYSLDGAAFIQQTLYDSLYAGNYPLLVMDTYGCSDTTEWLVWQPAAVLLNLPADVSITFGDSVAIKIFTTADPIVRWEWSTTDYLRDSNSLNTFAQPHASVQYALTLTDDRGCSASDAMNVTVERIRQVFVPNVLSSDLADDPNTRMTLGLGASVAQVKRFEIFDRWGDLVHRVSNRAPGDDDIHWDGTARSKPAPPGVYIWILEVELIDGTIERYQGDVTRL